MQTKDAFSTFLNSSNTLQNKLSLLKAEGYTYHNTEIPVDSTIIDKFFSDVDSLYKNNDISISIDKQAKIDEILYIINTMLPEIEKYVIVFSYFFKKKQEIIGKILEVSQEMVCYYRKRALKRIKLLYVLRQVDISDMEWFLMDNVTKKQKIAMIEYFKEHDLKRATDNIIIIENKKMTNRTVGIRITLGVKKLKNIPNDGTERYKTAQKYLKIFKILQQYNSLYCTQSRVKLKPELQL